MMDGIDFDAEADLIRQRGLLPSREPPERQYPWRDERKFDPWSVVRLSQKGVMRPVVSALAEHLRRRWYVTRDGAWYRYNGRFFERIGEDEVGACVQAALDAAGFDGEGIASVKRNVISAWKDNSEWEDVARREAEASGADLSAYGGWCIPFLDGIYSVRRDRLLPFTPLVWFDSAIGCRYDPSADGGAPEVYRAMMPDAAARRVWLQAIGYTLYSPSMHPASIFVVLGPGGSGKTKFMEVMEALIGPGHVSALSPLDLSERFGPVALRGMRANLCTESARDADDRRVVRADTLKKLASGDSVSADKKYDSMQKFRNRAKLWFAANKMPDLGFNDSGVGRRLHIFSMDDMDWVSPEALAVLFSDEGMSWLAFASLEAYLGFVISGAQAFEDAPSMLAYKGDFDMEDPFLVSLDRRFGTLDAEAVRHGLCDGGPAYLDELYEDYIRVLSEFGSRRAVSPVQFSVRLKTDFRIGTLARMVPDGCGGRSKRRLLVRMDGSRPPVQF